MSKRAEERGLEALPPRWRKTKDGKGKVDSALPVRKFYIRAYNQAEKDCALTWKDVQSIFRIADNYDSELNRPSYLTKEYCEEVLHRFNQIKTERNEKDNVQ